MPETRRGYKENGLDFSLIREAIKEELSNFRQQFYEGFKEELKNELVSAVVELFHNELKTIKEQLDECKNEIDVLRQNVNSTMHEKVGPTEEVISEACQRLYKRDYLIVSGLTEKETGTLEERRQHDLNLVVEVAQTLQCGHLQPEEVTRLGKIQPNKPRLLRFKCSLPRNRTMLLKNSKKLKQSEKFKAVFLMPDLTPAQRERNQNLRRELRRRREHGEDVKIMHNKIVPSGEQQRSHFQ